MNRIGLCFDATGTLIEMTAPVGEVYAELARAFGIDLPAWRLDDAFQRVLRHAPPRGMAGTTPTQRRQREFDWWSERIRQTFQATDSTARFADFPAFAAALFETYRDARRWRARPEVLATLEVLARSGHPMGVVSNFDHRLPEILQSMDIKHYFKTVLVPSDTGARKPDRRVFTAASDALEIPVDQLVYVGDDSPETLAEIAKHGLRTIDVAHLPSFKELPEWLESPAIVLS